MQSRFKSHVREIDLISSLIKPIAFNPDNFSPLSLSLSLPRAKW